MKHLLDKDIDMLVDDIIGILYDTSAGAYDPADEWISDLPGGGIIARTDPLSGKTTTLGVFDANNITVLAIPTSTIEAVIIAADLGADSASPLLCYMELAVPYSATGVDGVVTWNSSGIFELGAC